MRNFDTRFDWDKGDRYEKQKVYCSQIEELKKQKSNVIISVLCPGPVKTNFNNVANVNFSIKGLESEYVVKYAIKQLLKDKLVIIPGLLTKIGAIASKFAPIKLAMKIDYNIQKKKEK